MLVWQWEPLAERGSHANGTVDGEWRFFVLSSTRATKLGASGKSK